MLVLQERKTLLSDMSLAEGQGHRSFKGKISVPDVLGLFRLGPDGQRLQKTTGGGRAPGSP